jgi:hypothetical protein
MAQADDHNNPGHIAGMTSDYQAAADLLREHLALVMSTGDLELLAKLLASARRNDGRRPSRAEMIRIFETIRDAASTINDALSSPHILNRLAEGDDNFPRKFTDIWGNNLDLLTMVEAARRTIPTGPGSGGSATASEISPRAICALIVSELFAASGRERPRPTSVIAHTLAEALWSASGGPPWTGHAQNLASWRPHFIAAEEVSQTYQQAILREFVRFRTRHVERDGHAGQLADDTTLAENHKKWAEQRAKEERRQQEQWKQEQARRAAERAWRTSREYLQYLAEAGLSRLMLLRQLSQPGLVNLGSMYSSMTFDCEDSIEIAMRRLAAGIPPDAHLSACPFDVFPGTHEATATNDYAALRVLASDDGTSLRVDVTWDYCEPQ